jgi:hypothetical protein
MEGSGRTASIEKRGFANVLSVAGIFFAVGCDGGSPGGDGAAGATTRRPVRLARRAEW